MNNLCFPPDMCEGLDGTGGSSVLGKGFTSTAGIGLPVIDAEEMTSSIHLASSTSPIHITVALGYCEAFGADFLTSEVCRLRPFVNNNCLCFSLFGSSMIRDCHCRFCSSNW